MVIVAVSLASIFKFVGGGSHVDRLGRARAFVDRRWVLPLDNTGEMRTSNGCSLSRRPVLENDSRKGKETIVEYRSGILGTELRKTFFLSVKTMSLSHM